MMSDKFEIARNHLIESSAKELSSNMPQAQVKAVRVLSNIADERANREIIRKLHKLKGAARREAYTYLAQYYKEHYSELKLFLDNSMGRLRENSVSILAELPLNMVFYSLIFLVDDTRTAVHWTALNILLNKVRGLDDRMAIQKELISPLLTALNPRNMELYPQRIGLLNVLLLLSGKNKIVAADFIESISNLFAEIPLKVIGLLVEPIKQMPFDIKVQILRNLLKMRSDRIHRFLEISSSDLKDLKSFYEIIKVLLEFNVNIVNFLKRNGFIQNRQKYLKKDEMFTSEEQIIFCDLVIVSYKNDIFKMDSDADRQVFIFYLLKKLNSPLYKLRYKVISFIYGNKKILAELKNIGMYRSELYKLFRKLIRDPYKETRDIAIKIVKKQKPDIALPILIRGISIDDKDMRSGIIDYIKEKINERRKKFGVRYEDKIYEISYKIRAKYDPEIINELYDKVKDMNTYDIEEAVKLVSSVDDFRKLKMQLTKLMKHPNKNVRAFTISLVSILKSRDAFNFLVESLNDPDERVVANVIGAFESIMRPTDITILFPFLRDKNNRVRANTAHLFYKMGYKDIADKLILNLIKSGNMAMVNSALWVIRDLKLVQFRGIVDKILQNPQRSILKNAFAAGKALESV